MATKRFSLEAVIIIFFTSLTTFQTWAQCNATAAVESVRNGDFEAGYITKSGSGHSSTTGSPFDFQSDLISVTDYNAGAPYCLTGGIPGQYGVGRNEAALQPICGNSKPYLGNGYLSVTEAFTDHTAGKGGDGFALIGDFEGAAPASSYPGGLFPAIWRQRVTIIPNQPYFFSAWFANYNREADGATYNNPNLRFVVIPIDGSGTLMTALRTPVGSASPSGQMDWQQFYGTYTSPVGYTEAMLYIEVEQASDANTNDLAIDDISFINGCQNLSSLPPALTPNLGAAQSLCLSNGTITLNSNVNPGGATQYYWYSGSGSTQTPMGTPGSLTEKTMDITTSGTYRVCIQNSTFTPASCAASSTIVVNNTMPPVVINDQTLCAAPSVTMAANVVGPFLTYVWTVPAAFTPNPGNVSSFSTNVTGAYNVSVTSPIAGCTPKSDGATITTNIANANVSSVASCIGGTKTFNVTASGGSGSTYSWYSAPSGGTQLATGAPTVVGVASSPTTVYVENFSPSTMKTDQASYAGNDGGDNTRSISAFVANAPFVLISVEVQPVYCGDANFRISLYQNGSLVAGTEVVTPCATGSWITVPLNYSIPAGTGYELRITGNTGGRDDFLLNTTASSSNTSNGSASISSSVHGWSAFTNWVIKGASCLRTPVVLDCALPVNFVYFNASAEKNNTVLLHWITSSELNNASFEIERSATGQLFTSIGTVAAQNGSGQYNFIDEDPLYNTCYYRLRQIDLDGTSSFSNIEAVTRTSQEVLIKPNPNNGAFSVSIKGPSASYTIEIGDPTGRTLISRAVHGNETSVNLSAYPKGIYIVHVFNADANFFERVSVE